MGTFRVNGVILILILILWTQEVKNEEATKKNSNRMNTYIQNQEETIKIPWTHNEKGGLVKLKPNVTGRETR